MKYFVKLRKGLFLQQLKKYMQACMVDSIYVITIFLVHQFVFLYWCYNNLYEVFFQFATEGEKKRILCK